MTVLLAENDSRVTVLAERMLRPIAKEVLRAASYQQAHDILQSRECIDVALIDVVMDDGRLDECLELVRYLRAKYPRSVIMVWSGRINDVEQAVIDAGADGFIAKGGEFPVEKIYSLLLSALEKRAGDRTDPRANLDFNLGIMEKLLPLRLCRTH